MGKYTWEDIIINPNSEQAKACIGKEVYCADTPYYCLEKANDNEVYDTVYKLQKILPNDNYPFRLGESAEYEHCCIIPKKEEEHEYVPFESADEFLNAYENSKYNVINVTTEKKLISCGGIWLKSKCEADWITQCTELAVNGIILGLSHEFILWKELLDGYRFLDSTPCGKLKENTNDSI